MLLSGSFQDVFKTFVTTVSLGTVSARKRNSPVVSDTGHQSAPSPTARSTPDFQAIPTSFRYGGLAAIEDPVSALCGPERAIGAGCRRGWLPKTKVPVLAARTTRGAGASDQLQADLLRVRRASCAPRHARQTVPQQYATGGSRRAIVRSVQRGRPACVDGCRCGGYKFTGTDCGHGMGTDRATDLQDGTFGRGGPPWSPTRIAP